MHLKPDLVILVIQVKTLWIKIVFRGVANPHQVSQTFGQANFGCDDAIFLEVVDDLVVLEVGVVDLSALEGEFEVEKGA
jgi:hypothetical protein